MHVLVTGATGFVGRAVVDDLLAAGHRVTGLARSTAAADALAAAGVEAVLGSLDDLDVLSAAAGEADGVVHLAYKHAEAFDDGDHPVAAAADRAAVEALGRPLARSGGPLVVASTMAGHRPGATITEQDTATTTVGPTERLLTERLALDLADSGVRSSVVRMPPVHGPGDRSFLAWFVEIARRTGVAGYVGDGGNRWPAVHVGDAARLFRLACESALPRTVCHAVAEAGVPTRRFAEVLGGLLRLPARSVELEHFGTLGAFAAFDIVAFSDRTRDLLDWTPVGPTLLDDLADGNYRTAPAASRSC